MTVAGSGVKPTQANRDIPALTGIRFFAAGWVVLLHTYPIIALFFPWTGHLARIARSGNLGVDTFFVLSGFIITHTYLGQMSSRSPRTIARFYALRIGRIWPVHLLGIVIWLVLAWRTTEAQLRMQSLLTAKNIVMNVLMINALPGAAAINGPAWSISVEFAAYLAFPILALFLIHFRRSVSAYVAAGIVLLVGVTILMRDFSDDWHFITVEDPWLRIAIAFPTGCLLNVGWRNMRRWQRGPWWDCVAIICLFAIGISLLATPTTHIVFLPVTAIPFIALLVLACAGATGPVKTVLAIRTIRWGGRISYSLYMTHLAVLVSWQIWVINPHGLTVSSVFTRVVTLAGIAISVILVATLTYYLVEEPARRWVRRQTDRSALGSHRDLQPARLPAER